MEVPLGEIAVNAERDGYDALVISCMFDPGVDVAYEVTRELVVVGAGGAAFTLANLLVSDEFGVLAGAEKARPQLRRVLNRCGLSGAVMAMEVVDIDPRQYRTHTAWALERLYERATKLVAAGSQAIVLGCTGASELAAPLGHRLGVPVIDPALAAVKVAVLQCSMARDVGVRRVRRGLYEPDPTPPDVADWGQLVRRHHH